MGQTDLTLVNMTISAYRLISTIILPKMLTLWHLVHIKTLVVIYWNSSVALNAKERQLIDPS